MVPKPQFYLEASELTGKLSSRADRGEAGGSSNFYRFLDSFFFIYSLSWIREVSARRGHIEFTLTSCLRLSVSNELIYRKTHRHREQTYRWGALGEWIGNLGLADVNYYI